MVCFLQLLLFAQNRVEMSESRPLSLRFVPDFSPRLSGSRGMGASGSARNRRAPLNRAGSRNRTVVWAEQ
jgi:hypothetical protein